MTAYSDRASRLLKAEGADYEAAIALVPSSDGSLLRAAHEQVQALGATPAAAILARRLRELDERNRPRGPRGATRENPAGPTNRELEVLPLLTQGLRNAEIAKRLVVTPKTSTTTSPQSRASSGYQTAGGQLRQQSGSAPSKTRTTATRPRK